MNLVEKILHKTLSEHKRIVRTERTPAHDPAPAIVTVVISVRNHLPAAIQHTPDFERKELFERPEKTCEVYFPAHAPKTEKAVTETKRTLYDLNYLQVSATGNRHITQERLLKGAVGI